MYIRTGLFSFNRSRKVNWDKLFVSSKNIHLHCKEYLKFTKNHCDVFPVALAMVNTDLVSLY